MHRPLEHLEFAIDDRRFAIRLDQIQEIVRAVWLARLPKAPPIVEGLLDLRGTVVPVLDIRARFRLPPRVVDPSDHIVIARARERVVGIRIDRARHIVALDEAEIADIEAIAPGCDYVAGVAKQSDGLLLIHDLATFLSAAEAESIDDLVEERLPA